MRPIGLSLALALASMAIEAGAQSPPPSAAPPPTVVPPAPPQIPAQAAPAPPPAIAAPAPAPAARAQTPAPIPAAAPAPATAPAAPAPPAPEPASDVGLTIGLRGGYSVPFGHGKNTPMTDVVERSIPIGLDVGWFFDRHLYAGASFVYGFASNSVAETSTCPYGQPDVSCSASQLHLGLGARWHFLPARAFDPWIGLGFGYDILNLKASDSTGNVVLSASLHGFDFFDVEAGVDYKPRRWFGIGPFVGVSAGHYASDTSPGTTTHGWVTVGLRLRTGT
jgi:hypothetical protein